MKSAFEVMELPAWHVAYVRHVGPYNQIGEAFGRIFGWAGQRGLLRFPETQSLALYHDDPGATPAEALRSDACLTVPPGTPVDGDVAAMDIPGGLFAVGHFELDMTEFPSAWQALGEYLPTSGHQPTEDRPCYEWYKNNPEQHPEHKFIVDICWPVRPPA